MKIFSLGVIAATTLLLASCGSGSKMIQGKDLPQPAQQFISVYFPDAQVQLAQKDKELEGTEYKVMLDNGFALEFNGKGEWTQINGTPQSVPTNIVPATITQYVNLNFPEQTILVLEREKRGYVVLMLNDTELKFDPQGQLTHWDD